MALPVNMSCASVRGYALPGRWKHCRQPTKSAMQQAQARAVSRASRRALVCQASATPLASGGWPLWTALTACAAFSQVVEKRTPFGAVLSAPLASMVAAIALAVLKVIPTAAPAYDAVWVFVMPLAAALCLLESDLRKLWSTAASTLAAFLVGAAGTVLGTAVAFWLVGNKLGPEGYKVAAALCASYIGGSVNFAAVSQALSLAPGPLLAGAMTADNIAMAIYIAIIMSIPAGAPKQAACADAAKQPGSTTASGNDPSSSSSSSSSHSGRGSKGETAILEDAPPSLAAPPLTAETASLSLAAAAAACMLGNMIADAVGFSSGALAVMALLASGAAMLGATIVKRHGSSGAGSPFAGAEALGSALMMLFFATIGAGAGSLQALSGCWWLLVFIAVQLGVHLAVCIGGGRLLRLPMRAILVASNANVGGSATAAAFATAKGWQEMVQPAMLTGSLGYAIATALGTAVGYWLRAWQLA